MNFYFAAVFVDYMLYGPEAHAVALMTLGGSAELEDGGQDVGGDAGAVVGDYDFYAGGLANEFDYNASVGVADGWSDGFAGVADDVEEDLASFSGKCLRLRNGGNTRTVHGTARLA